MIEYKCSHCNKNTSLTHIKTAPQPAPSAKLSFNEIWNCEPCHISYEFYNNILIGKGYHTTIREQKYTWTCRPISNTSFIMNNVGIIQDFNFMPELTPQTIKDKLKTYLNFL